VNYRLSNKAEQDLRNIYRYTVSNFGQLQAEAYLSGLEETLVQVSDTPMLAQKVDDIRKGYRRYLYQEHAVCFIEKKPLIYVVRVLHKQMRASLHLG
jgi:toxin ParE1/3/4